MNDDTLVLYYYNDGLSDAERREVERALASDDALRARYEALCAGLDGIDDDSGVAAPADMVARLHDSLERAAQLERQRGEQMRDRPRWPAFAWGAALAATLVAGISIGLYLAGGAARDPVITPQVAGDPVRPAATPVAFERGLQHYLQTSRQDLAELPGDTVEARSRLVSDMVRQNRLFERVAMQNGSHDVARLLRAIEPVLLRIKNDDLAAADIMALQQQLYFELGVMLTRMARDESGKTGPI